MKKIAFIFCISCCFSIKAQQMANYVSNGSFEEYDTCVPPPFIMYIIKDWQPPDSLGYNPLYASTCNNMVPIYGDAYQYPHTGESYISLRCYPSYPADPLKRIYAKNRMKSTLQAGQAYCVKFYINNYNGNPYAVDSIGAYLGGSDIDTIHYCNIPLIYLTPQIQNPLGNIVTDTLNWIPITGTFTANGAEKYLILGNFLSDENTDTLFLNPTHSPLKYADLNIDDLSCIPIDLDAYAGRDTTILIGDSVYIGRELDFAIDPYCVWYKLPDITNAIGTTSGMWVKPSDTTTYVVKQDLECGGVKWDTVVVSVKYDVGIREYETEKWQVELYPNPAANSINIVSKGGHESEELNVTIKDLTGRIIYNARVKTKSFIANIELNLLNGAYLMTISSNSHENVTKKLLITK